ncbi:EGF-like domain protein [Necator americanus]|uniref:EGF-like domain protein n=1 Tax=Necator americanus TaxID=51031 RepID=W2TYL2_NECAM|nr:EGF-like domain protein [Necator americanus]ETN86938.1 EGF-like domain protein [Necator americanus]
MFAVEVAKNLQNHHLLPKEQALRNTRKRKIAIWSLFPECSMVWGGISASVANTCDPNPCPTTTNSMYVCNPGTGSYTCDCKPGYTGANCDLDMASVCSTSPCLNGGTCSTKNNVDYTCGCAPGYLGIRCQCK